MKKPLISVVIPCHNQEKYLEKCLLSITEGGISDYEIIAVDDGSTDGTPEILSAFSKKCNRMRTVSLDGRGAGAARNLGMKYALGEFILFMDSDDYLERGALGVLAAAVGTSCADIYFFNFKTFDNKTGYVRDRILFSDLPKSFEHCGKSYGYSELTFSEKKAFFIWSYVAPWNKLYRRAFIEKHGLEFDELYSTNDRTFYFASLVTSDTVTALDAVLINYRINNGSSLTGIYDAEKLENRKRAYLSSLRWIDSGDRVLCENFFKVTVLDFVSFYGRCQPSERFDLFLKTAEFFRDMDTRNIGSAHTASERSGFYFKYFSESLYLRGRDPEKTVPIVFATNEKYLPYLCAALRSVIENSDDESFYDVYVFHTGITRHSEERICRMTQKNLHIRALNVGAFVKNLHLYSKGHFSVEMYYRILIPEILSQYQKVLYLDCDLVLCADAKELFSLYIGDKVIGAVRNPLDKGMHGYVTRTLMLRSEEYFNSGVLLINTEKFREEGMRERCFDVLSKYPSLACPDQDVLNLSCRGRVEYLDEVWNFQLGNHRYTPEGKYALAEKIKVYHFTTGEKPWNTEGLPLSEMFWKYARSSPFYEDIVLNYVCSVSDKRARERRADHASSGQNAKTGEKNKKRRSFVFGAARLIGKFFSHWHRYGFVCAVRKAKEKLVCFCKRRGKS